MATAPATKAPAPVKKQRTDSEKAENFHKAAPARVDRVLKAVASLRTIARPVRYGWTAQERQEIFSAIASAVESCEAAFRSPGTAKSAGFHFTKS